MTALQLCLAQMTSADNHADNIAWMREAASRAAKDGAQLLALPEVAGLMNRDPEQSRRQVTTHAADPFVAACRKEAARHRLWIHTGSTPVLAPGGDRYLNHADLIGPDGGIVASYDKIHLFDVFLEGRPPTGESRRFAAGARAVLAGTPWGLAGLSICYDLRFPQLYRDYARAGAVLLFVPSAFTVPTGRAHWEVLLRARAIETGAFVIAAAQVGPHADGRRTWGHAMVVSPWGEVLVDMGGDDPGLATVDLDLAAVDAARRQIPSLQGDRPYGLDRPVAVDGPAG
ncbi:hypothetical protein OCGS_1351 [Oceaniovalibus guishaninsula JLT2003]|uniref:CN hydrolase domain-containing protein n=1 Tax=Oceaniovalibus guishaninsula JLT2003 TaxID=1231392 RepID=K2HAF7_9RHOB|nr:carbon-nitrogen hydrolase family protein [Oceaniovalibus guishaninsula]EKE44513.1 hypothetical protein OCGS_1351 [Oceaniovalibus guishaninsula JLT2003]